MSWREAVLRLLRVPPDPAPPPGTPPLVFRAARNFYFLRIFRFVAAQLFAAFAAITATVVFYLAIRDAPTQYTIVFRIFGILTWTVYALQLLFHLSVLKLDYELRWYMLSDRAIRIREGITTVREKTITLANIQNIAVRQGPLQRLLGIADVEVTTAGGGGAAPGKQGHQPLREAPHMAWFRGVDNAPEIRNLLLAGVRRQKDAGLGDHDDHHHADDVRHAASELLDEARKLRASADRM